MPIQTLDIENFESKAENLYEAVVIVSKRSKQINDEVKIELSKRLEPVIAKNTENDTVMNLDKLDISLEFEARQKPAHQAISDCLNGDLTFRYKEDN